MLWTTALNLLGAESMSSNQLIVWVSIDHSFFDLANFGIVSFSTSIQSKFWYYVTILFQGGIKLPVLLCANNINFLFAAYSVHKSIDSCDISNLYIIYFSSFIELFQYFFSLKKKNVHDFLNYFQRKSPIS